MPRALTDIKAKGGTALLHAVIACATVVVTVSVAWATTQTRLAVVEKACRDDRAKLDALSESLKETSTDINDKLSVIAQDVAFMKGLMEGAVP